MAEMTKTQVRDMTAKDIAAALRRAFKLEDTNKAITFEHGWDLINIVAIHGEALADALDAMAPETVEG